MRKAATKRRTKPHRGKLNYDEKQKHKTTLMDKVPHEYRDWSAAVPKEQAPQSRTPSIKFPAMLYMMLETLQRDGNDIVHWQPHGRAFVIRDRDKFGQLLETGRHFATTKIVSFHRQLNLYNFKRISNGPDKHAYYHECFLRGKPFLLPLIQRSANKGVGVRLQSNPQDEPNFWNGTLPWVVDVKPLARDSRVKLKSAPTRQVKLPVIRQVEPEPEEDDDESIESQVIHNDGSVTDNDPMTQGTSAGTQQHYPLILHPFFPTLDLLSSLKADYHDTKYPADVSLDNSVDVGSLEFGQSMSAFLSSD